MNSFEISFSVFYILLNKFRGGGGGVGGRWGLYIV